MATKTATAAQSTAPARYDTGPGDITRVVEYTLNGVTLSAGDVIQLAKVPAGAKFVDFVISWDLLGAAGTSSYTFTGLGDGNDADRYMASQSAVTSAVVRMSIPGGQGYAYTAEDTIDLTVGTVTSGTAATGTVRLSFTYYNAD